MACQLDSCRHLVRIHRTCRLRLPPSSLGSSVAIAFNETTNHFELFYVGFKASNDSTFVNREGRIFRAVSNVPGNTPEGIEGPYTDVGVIMQPINDSPPWEGEQGVDSLQPYYLGKGRGWAAFYGSCNTQDPAPEIKQVVGQAFAPTLAGPWVRSPADRELPCNLSVFDEKIEQPIVTRLRDGSFVAVFDALNHEVEGMLGYSWSPDGVRWNPLCSQLLDVGNRTAWITSVGRKRVRTPQGVIQLADNSLLLSFSGFDGNASNPTHESLGFATLVFDTQ